MYQTCSLPRRNFLKSAAVGLAAAVSPLATLTSASLSSAAPRYPAGAPNTREAAPWKVQPFPMDRVRLRTGPCKDALEANQAYLHRVPNDRLLYSFRMTAGFPSHAEPLGGWEGPQGELRGHFSGGHYLSACALTYASTGDDALRSKAAAMITELARCQKALGGSYLSAYPTEFYDRLRAGKRVWAPFYTYHKILAGHLDMFQHCGNEQALSTAEGMARWAAAWVRPFNDQEWARIQLTEFGGMAEALYNLYGITGKEEYLAAGRRFDDKSVFDPLAAGRDELKGHHANTNIPKVIGAARAYELTGEQRYRDIADYFWREVVSQRTYCTGGTSNGEYWGDAGKISQQLGPDAEECCCSYNMMKLTRHMYGWSADPAALDYYERLLFNARLGAQARNGMLMYYISVSPGLYRTFSTPFHSFWCCCGTGVEEFSKINDTIYFHDDRDLYVNLFIASELDWRERGLRIVQRTSFPEQSVSTLAISADRPLAMAIHVRVPYWALQGATFKVNGKPERVEARPGTYATIDRTWRTGDELEISVPMSLRVEPTPDDPSVQAMMYGPLVLAGDFGPADLAPNQIYGPTGPDLPPAREFSPPPYVQASRNDSGVWAEAVPGEPLVFRTIGEGESVRLAPFYKVVRNRYTIYWKLRA